MRLITMAQLDFSGTPKEAIALQKALADSIALTPLSKTPETIAGVDVSLERFGTELFAGIVVLSFPDLEMVEYATVQLPVAFPYIPGLLSFREIPGLLRCYEALKTKPDVIIADGQGIAHPRRLGIATHLGILLDIPTIGCAKSRLYGTYIEPEVVGEAAAISDPKTGEVIGMAYKSKARSNPLIISPGNKITVQESLQIVRQCLRGYRLPEPTRLAHAMVNKARRKEL